MRFINGTRLDDRIIRTDWDAGFKEGRQFGRGKSGGQVRIRNFVCSDCLTFTCIQVFSYMEQSAMTPQKCAESLSAVLANK